MPNDHSRRGEGIERPTVLPTLGVGVHSYGPRPGSLGFGSRGAVAPREEAAGGPTKKGCLLGHPEKPFQSEGAPFCNQKKADESVLSSFSTSCTICCPPSKPGFAHARLRWPPPGWRTKRPRSRPSLLLTQRATVEGEEQRWRVDGDQSCCNSMLMYFGSPIGSKTPSGGDNR